MPPEREIVLVYGMTGMGKTRWTRAFLRSQERVLVMDTQVEHDGILFNDLGDMIEHIMKYRTFRVRTEFVDDFPLLCSIAFAAGKCWLVIEETQRILPASRMEPPAAFLDVIYRGRHKQVNVLMVSQRPSTVHISARSQWSRIVTFRQTEPADVDWITNVSGFQAINPLTLPPSTYYEITPGGWSKKILADTKKTLDKPSDIPDTEHVEQESGQPEQP